MKWQGQGNEVARRGIKGRRCSLCTQMVNKVNQEVVVLTYHVTRISRRDHSVCRPYMGNMVHMGSEHGGYFSEREFLKCVKEGSDNRGGVSR